MSLSNYSEHRNEGGGHRHDLEWKFFQQQESLMHWTPQQTHFFETTSNYGGQAMRHNMAVEFCDSSEHPKERPTKRPCHVLQALPFRARDNPDFQRHRSAEVFLASPSGQLRCTKATRGKPSSRLSHKIVERRYRTNLNAQVEGLRFAVPFLKKRPLPLISRTFSQQMIICSHLRKGWMSRSRACKSLFGAATVKFALFLVSVSGQLPGFAITNLLLQDNFASFASVLEIIYGR